MYLVISYEASKLRVFRQTRTTEVDSSSTNVRTKKSVSRSRYWAMYPDMIGKSMRANDPADANHPRSVPCGLRPTTDDEANERIYENVGYTANC
jgi:hypothetical protein